MNKLKKVFLALAVVAAFGTANALAQCSANSTSPIVRSESTVELIGAVTINCTAAPGTSQASVSITLNPASTVFVATDPAPDNKSTFPEPTLQESSAAGGDGVFCTADDTYAAVSNLLSLGAGTNTLTFTFNPGGVNTVICVNGLRANINASGLPAGSTLTANVVTGGSISAITNTLIVGVVNTGLRVTGTDPTEFVDVVNLLACVDEDQNLVVRLVEGFASAWQAPEPDAVAGEGTRFRIRLSGIPSGVTINAPDEIGGISTMTSGTLDTNSTTDNLTLTRVDGTAADGSGGTVVTPVSDNFDEIPVTGGVAIIVYEVTNVNSTTLVSTGVTININIVSTVGAGTGTIAGSIGFGPVGPPTGNAHRPQFAAAADATAAVVADCVTRLLYSWVVNVAGYDTGIAIANTSEDDDAFAGTGFVDATAQSGTCTMTGYPSDGSAPISYTTASIGAGETLAFNISGVPGFSDFAGYVLTVCNFLDAHSFAFITNGFGSDGGPNLAQGYQALVVTLNRTGSGGEGLPH